MSRQQLDLICEVDTLKINVMPTVDALPISIREITCLKRFIIR